MTQKKPSDAFAQLVHQQLLLRSLLEHVNEDSTLVAGPLQQQSDALFTLTISRTHLDVAPPSSVTLAILLEPDRTDLQQHLTLLAQYQIWIATRLDDLVRQHPERLHPFLIQGWHRAATTAASFAQEAIDASLDHMKENHRGSF